MIFDHYINNDFYKTGYINNNFHIDVLDYFGQVINDN